MLLQRLHVNLTVIEKVKLLPENLSKIESLDKVKEFVRQDGESDDEVARICGGLQKMFPAL